MIDRYKDLDINKIWSDKNKLFLWLRTEMAVMHARLHFKDEISWEDYERIKRSLEENPIDIEWWKAKDKEIHHDLNAFIQERIRFMPKELRKYFHQGMTSYDTEEPAFVKMIKDSIKIVERHYFELEKIIKEMAMKYRYTIMNGRTHGQEAEMQSFGKRCLTWLQDLRISFRNLRKSKENLRFSKLSGAIGNYGGVTPAIETKALKFLGFKPQYGATQIMPRELYAPIAQGLSQIVATINKIALTIRLGARSGRPIYQEPFAKKQTGSSAMPHKKNTISTEQMEGMYRMAKAYAMAIMENIQTWEERAIEQSCVERVCWPDLFHVTIRVLKVMKRVLGGLVVYPNNMLQEIYESRGCYASSHAKEILKQLGFDFNEAYRIVQLAAFNVFESAREERFPKSFDDADKLITMDLNVFYKKLVSIKEIISEGNSKVSLQLSATKEEVQNWNNKLREVFQHSENLELWSKIFLPSYLLRNEDTLYRRILRIT